MPERIFGQIPGYSIGSWFESRSALSAAGVHRPRIAGISGTESEGADSIVLSGGYEDDDYHCQVCRIRLEGTAGPYAEAAHIRPLGKPHNGSDSLDNLLCLCPNHHVLFDLGGFSIADDLSLLGSEGVLIVIAQHQINLDNLRYHREHYFL